VKKLHKLLYYCQGHHLAHFGEALFREPIMAYDMGPLVANLWKAEKDGRPAPAPEKLDAGQLNTIGYVVSRYGRLTGTDLERLTHNETPWQQANENRPPGGSVRISQATIKMFFRAGGGPDPELPWPSAPDVQRLTAGAEQRRARPGRADDVAALRARSQNG
jgi:uncharacterized phage-associated protein